MASPLDAGTVAICSTADGTPTVRLSEKAAPGSDCRSREVDVPVDRIAWGEPLPRPLRAGETLAVVTTERGTRRLEVRTPEPAAATPAALPVGMPLLPRLTARPYGVEGRVDAVQRDGRLMVRCRPGTRTAGVVLDAGPARLPRDAAFRLIAEHVGGAGFRLSAVPAGLDAGHGSPLGPSGRTAIPHDAASGAVQFVLQCPSTSGDAQLRDLRLEPAMPPAPTQRTAWAWEPERWRQAPDRLIADAVARGLDRLHVSLDIAEGRVRHRAALAAFIRAAAAKAVAVDAVEGDPRMVRAAGRTNALQRARAIAAYQRAADSDARLAGIQYDIEPYLLPEFGTDRSGVLAAWSATIGDLSEAVGAPLDVVVPFWLIDRPDGEAALDRIAGRLGRVTVMAYRRDPAQVVEAAEPILAWGVRRGLPVRVALEMGRLDDEVETQLRPAASGGFAVVPIGDRAVLLQLGGDVAIAGSQPFEAAGTTRIAGERLSFQGDAERMIAAAAELRAPLSAWRSFDGFAFHGLF